MRVRLAIALVKYLPTLGGPKFGHKTRRVWGPSARPLPLLLPCSTLQTGRRHFSFLTAITTLQGCVSNFREFVVGLQDRTLSYPRAKHASIRATRRESRVCFVWQALQCPVVLSTSGGGSDPNKGAQELTLNLNNPALLQVGSASVLRCVVVCYAV